MGFSLASISKGATIKAPRIVILGPEKVGKTSFSCGSQFDKGELVATGLNDPIVISVKGEEGADDLDVAKFPTAMSFNDVIEAIGALYQEEHQFRTAVIDSASALEPLVWDAVCKRNKVQAIEQVGGGFGKGYIEAAQEWRRLTKGLDALRERGMATIIIGRQGQAFR